MVTGFTNLTLLSRGCFHVTGTEICFVLLLPLECTRFDHVLPKIWWLTYWFRKIRPYCFYSLLLDLNSNTLSYLMILWRCHPLQMSIVCVFVYFTVRAFEIIQGDTEWDATASYINWWQVISHFHWSTFFVDICQIYGWGEKSIYWQLVILLPFFS